MTSATLIQCINRISATAIALKKTQQEEAALELQESLALLVEVQQQQQVHQEIKQECQQIEAERSRLIAIVEASADYIATATSDGNILWNNPQLKKIRGLNPEGSVTHLKIADYHPLWAVEMIQQQGISAAIQHGVWVGETALLDEHGQEIPVSQMIVAHKSADGTVDYLSTVMRDISDKRRAEQHIRFQSRLLDAVEQAVIATDLQGNITYWNRFAEVLYGWKAEEVLGHFILDITPASMAQAEATEIFSHLQVGERWSGEFLVQRRDGTIFPIMITDAPIYDENGVLSGIVGISMDMTKLKQAERALRESEQLFRQLAENIRDIFFVYSADLQLLYVSPAYEELWGESREYRYAHPDAWLDQIHSEDRDRIIGILPQINQHNLTYEYRILRQDSQERWIRTRTFLVNDESGNLHRIVGISEDCTERKQLELALQQSEKRFRSAFETAAVGMCLVSPEGRCLDANRSVCQLLGYSKQELLTLTWREITYPEDVETDLKLAQQLWDGEISSYQLEKRYLHKRGQIIWGLLSVSLIRDLRQNPLYFIGQLQDISDRKAAELSLRTVSDRLQYLLTASPAVIFSSPTHGDYTATFISPNVSSILGYEAQNFRESSKFWAMRVHPDDLERITSSFPKIFEQGSCSYEYRFLHADGTYHWLSSQLRLVQDELGNPLEFVGYMIDISDKKRTEEKLRETQQHLQAILDYSPAAIYVIDRDNKHLLVNRCYETLVSMTPEKIIGKTIYEVWPTEFCDAFAINNQQILQSGEPMEFEEVAPHADGMHTYITIKFPLYNTNGDAYAVCGISADITERKQAEEELRTSQRFIQKIADSSPNLLYLYDLEEQRNIYVNRRITQMLGYTPEEVQAMGNQLFPTLMHPDDLRVAPEKQRQMAAACDGDVIDFEYRLRHKNGEWRWLYSWDTPFARNADGKPTQILGTATDISDRKQLELALQQSEERFRTCVENLLDGLALFSSIRDATGQILDFRFEYINPAGCKANRTPREETLGRTLCELLPAHRDTGIFDAYCQVVETGESLIQEAALFEDIYGGERMQRFFDFQAIKLGDGFMVTWRDVTERKRTEEQIQASLQEKEVLLKEIHHRVKNNLQVILSLLKLQSSYTNNAKTIQMFQESQNRIRSMALIHELLYQSQDLARIDFGAYIHTLVNQLARTYTVNTSTIAWEINVDPPTIQLTIDTALPCGLLINELISNALKYAFPPGQPGRIRISLQACNNQQFILVISDNGVGISSDLDFRHTDSLGLQLVCGTTAQLGGTIELDRTQGTTFTIRFQEVKYKPRE